MGELLGIPEWLAATGFVVISLALWIVRAPFCVGAPMHA